MIAFFFVFDAPPPHMSSTNHQPHPADNLRGVDFDIPLLEEPFIGEHAAELEEAWRKDPHSVLPMLMRQLFASLGQRGEPRVTSVIPVRPVKPDNNKKNEPKSES